MITTIRENILCRAIDGRIREFIAGERVAPGGRVLIGGDPFIQISSERDWLRGQDPEDGFLAPESFVNGASES